jgi:hypothetical protein
MGTEHEVVITVGTRCAGERYDVDPRDILAALGRHQMVAVQEDWMLDVVLEQYARLVESIISGPERTLAAAAYRNDLFAATIAALDRPLPPKPQAITGGAPLAAPPLPAVAIQPASWQARSATQTAVAPPPGRRASPARATSSVSGAASGGRSAVAATASAWMRASRLGRLRL